MDAVEKYIHYVRAVEIFPVAIHTHTNIYVIIVMERKFSTFKTNCSKLNAAVALTVLVCMRPLPSSLLLPLLMSPLSIRAQFSFTNYFNLFNGMRLEASRTKKNAGTRKKYIFHRNDEAKLKEEKIAIASTTRNKTFSENDET